MDSNIVSLLTKIFICFYWVILIGHNIYNYGKMNPEAKKRNYWIKALIVDNFAVIILTILAFFTK